MVAYHCGKAAKVAPPAVSSQTSLPSQVFPMALMSARRSSSFLPRTGSNMPTPKSKPSRKKKPIQRTAISMNQMICRVSCDIASSSVLRADHGRSALERLVVRRLDAGNGELLHQVDVRHHQAAVDDGKSDQADHEVSGCQVRGDRPVDRQQPLDDPRLAAHLSED